MVQCPHPCSPYSQGGAARRLTGRCPLLCSCAGCPAGDLGYLVTLVSDACATYSQQRHEASLAAVAGYCRQRTTAELLEELQQEAGRREAAPE